MKKSHFAVALLLSGALSVASATEARSLPAACSVMIHATSVCMKEAADRVQALNPDAAQDLVREDYETTLPKMLKKRADAADYCTSAKATNSLVISMQDLSTKYGVDKRQLLTPGCQAAARPFFDQVIAKHPELAN
ncbi:MAG TPA: hypothetical protein VL689_11845 [Paraburkholderia sp.]|jgi:hypothetical protein|nr:hypothetical protein [Paraburkholderia sp.]